MERDGATFKVGLLVLVAGVGLLYMLYRVGGWDRAFEKRIEVTVSFDNAKGLKRGAPVFYAGVQVGSVREVRYQRGEVRPIRVVFTAPDRPENMPFSLGDRVTIVEAMVMGDPKLAIEPDPEGERYAAGQVIPGTQTQSFTDKLTELLTEETRDRIKALVDNMAGIAETTNQMLAKNEERLTKILDNMETTSAEAADFLKTNRPKLEGMLGDLKASTDDVAAMTKTLRKEKTVENMAAVVANFVPVSQELKKGAPEITATLKNARKASDQAVILVEGVQPDKGVLALLNDQKEAERMRAILRDFQFMVRAIALLGVSDLVADMRVGEAVFEAWKNQPENRNLPPEELMRKWRAFQAKLEAEDRRLMEQTP